SQIRLWSLNHKENLKLHSCKYCRRGLPAPGAEGYQGVFRLPPLQFMDCRDAEAASAVSHGVSKCQGAAIDIEFRPIGLKLFGPGQRDWRKGFVHFEQVDIIHFQ